MSIIYQTPNKHSIPIVRFVIPFIAGIVSAVFIPHQEFSSQHLLITLVVSAMMVFICYCIKSYKIDWVYGLTITISMYAFGWSSTDIRLNSAKSSAKTLTGSFSFTIAEVISQPETKKNSIKVVLRSRVLNNEEALTHVTGDFIAYLEPSEKTKELNPGDLIILNAELQEVAPPKNPGEFNYKQYLAFHSIHVQTYLPDNNWAIIHHSNQSSIYGLADAFRNYLIQQFISMGITGKELNIAAALVLGKKTGLDDQTKRAYSSAGAMHVLAVSGLHVGFIYLLLIRILSVLNKWSAGKWAQSILLLILLWIYALITGLSPSVLRACTMFSFMIIAKVTKRKPNFFNTLACSAFLLLVINPLIIMEVGFQLSYAAVLGIVIIQPWLSQFFYSRYWLIQKTWEISTVSIAAQLGTFPLGLLYFHQFPNYFLFSNLFVIPLATLILFAGIGFLIIHKLPLINELFAFILEHLIRLLNHLVYWVDSLPYAMQKNIHFTVFDTWYSYTIMIGFILLVIKRKFNYLAFSLVALILFCTSNLVTYSENNKQRKIIINHVSKHTLVQFIKGSNSYIYCSDTSYIGNDNYLFHTANFHTQNHIQSISLLKNDIELTSDILFMRDPFYKFLDKKLVILDGNLNTSSAQTPLDINYLLYSEQCKLPLSSIKQLFNFDKIIFDGSLPRYRSEHLVQQAIELNFDYHNTQEEGAFCVDLN